LRLLGGRVAGVEQVRVPGLEDHVLAVFEKTAPTPREYPRDPAARRRRPLGGDRVGGVTAGSGIGSASGHKSRYERDPGHGSAKEVSI
jgi:uncharacterized protein YcfJ